MPHILVKAVAERLLASSEREMGTVLRQVLNMPAIETYRGGRCVFLYELHDCLSERLAERLTCDQPRTVVAAIRTVQEGVAMRRANGRSSDRRKVDTTPEEMAYCGAAPPL